MALILNPPIDAKALEDLIDDDRDASRFRVNRRVFVDEGILALEHINAVLRVGRHPADDAQ